jgi:steroid delta-isomerase-like uncharacterized protein
MDSQAAKAIAARFYEPFNQRALTGLAAVLHPQWTIHPEIPGDEPDAAKYRPRAEALLVAFPDLNMQVDQLIAEGSFVATRVTISGTQQGEWLGVPASGRRISITAHDVHRIEQGRIAESWHVEDWLTALGQMRASF